MIDKIKELIKPDDRIIMANKEILPLQFPVKQKSLRSNPFAKPLGLWYAIGLEWIEWVEKEMPEWMGRVFYKIEVNNAKLKLIRNEEELEKFTKIYGINTDYPSMRTDMDTREISWENVAGDFSGIEVAPYQWESRLKYDWYYGWDVASGCIWEKDGIVSAKRITV